MYVITEPSRPAFIEVIYKVVLNRIVVTSTIIEQMIFSSTSVYVILQEYVLAIVFIFLPS